jgi:hypothetical protein
MSHSIQRSQADLGWTTHKLGRPYTLVSTKNQASYEHTGRGSTKRTWRSALDWLVTHL